MLILWRLSMTVLNGVDHDHGSTVKVTQNLIDWSTEYVQPFHLIS